MAQPKEMEQRLRQCYALERELHRLKQWQQRLEAELPEYKFRQRTARTERIEYEAAGLSALLDRLSGKREQKLEGLCQAERRAEAALQAQLREQKTLEQEIADAEQALEDLRTKVAAEEPDWPEELVQLKLRLEAQLWAGNLIPLLQNNRRQLLSAREWAQGSNLEFARRRDLGLGESLAQADAAAKQCREAMERLEGCGILLEIHPYFTNPAGYIAGVTQFNQLERINRALDALLETEKQAQSLQEQLKE